MERVHRVSLKRHQKVTGGTTDELRQDEIASMEGNDRQAEDISNTLLRSAGSPLVEPNPERFQQTGVTLVPANEERAAFSCPVCGKAFSLRHSLRRHIKMHN